MTLDKRPQQQFKKSEDAIDLPIQWIICSSVVPLIIPVFPCRFFSHLSTSYFEFYKFEILSSSHLVRHISFRCSACQTKVHQSLVTSCCLSNKRLSSPCPITGSARFNDPHCPSVIFCTLLKAIIIIVVFSRWRAPWRCVELQIYRII